MVLFSFIVLYSYSKGAYKIRRYFINFEIKLCTYAKQKYKERRDKRKLENSKTKFARLVKQLNTKTHCTRLI